VGASKSPSRERLGRGQTIASGAILGGLRRSWGLAGTAGGGGIFSGGGRMKLEN